MIKLYNIFIHLFVVNFRSSKCANMAEDVIGLCGHVAKQRATNGSLKYRPNSALSGAQKSLRTYDFSTVFLVFFSPLSLSHTHTLFQRLCVCLTCIHHHPFHLYNFLSNQLFPPLSTFPRPHHYNPFVTFFSFTLTRPNF